MDNEKVESSNNLVLIDNIDMDATTQTHHSLHCIDSLFSIILDYVVDNLNLYLKENDEKLDVLPSHIKNRILRRFTSSAHFWRNTDFKKVLAALVNEQTYCINLTAASVDDEVLKILWKCKNVRKLYLSRTKDINISTKGLIHLLQNCHHIVHFVLTHSVEINDDVLKCISENCPNLMGLDIGGSISVSDLGVKNISNLNHLSWVTLSSTQVTDEGISHLVRGPCKLKLKELRIENTKVTDIGLREVAENCPNLEVLTFYSRKGRDDISCPTFSSELKNLKQLTWTVNW